MSIPSLMSALAQGYSSSQIIKWLSTNSKKFSKQIKSALSQGYTDDQILTYLTKGKHASHGERNKMLGGMTEGEKGARIFNVPTDWSKVKQVGELAATAATGYGIAKAAPAAVQGIKGLFKGQNPFLAPNIGPKPMANAPTQAPQVAPASQATIPTHPVSSQTNNAQAAQPAQSQPPNPQPQSQIPPQQSIQIIGQLGVADQIKNLQKTGNTPEAIATAVSVSMKPNQKKWLEEQMKAGTAKSLPEMVDDFMSQAPQEIQQAGEQNAPSTQENVQKIEEIEKPLSKGETVSSISGKTGQLQSIREKEALVKDDDGKLHKVKVEDLVAIPDEIKNKDYHSIAQEYISTFPEEGKGSLSDALSVMAYDPQKNELIAAFPDNPTKMWRYSNVEPELYEEIISASTAPKTSGGTGIPGTWNVNTADSRGSPFRKISQNKEKYPFTTFEVGYNMFGPLAQAIKEMRKQKRKSDNERKKTKIPR